MIKSVNVDPSCRLTSATLHVLIISGDLFTDIEIPDISVYRSNFQGLIFRFGVLRLKVSKRPIRSGVETQRVNEVREMIFICYNTYLQYS